MDKLFSRQINILGENCQEQLSKSVVLVAGIGGLGCLLSELLTRAGIGKIYIVDNGVVDLPDLNRQIFYTIKDLGKKKTDIAAGKLIKITEKTDINKINAKIDNNFKIPDDVMGVIDCLDNFKARYILEELSYKKNIFFIHGAIDRWYGQITTIVPNKTKRLKEIFPDVKDTNSIISVFGFTSSLIASIQAAETIKVLCKKNSNLLNKILFIDIKNYSFEVAELS